MTTRKRRPVIGVTGPARHGRVLWMFSLFAVRRAGGRPIRINTERPVDRNRLDGLLVAGGADIDPSMYGQPNVNSRHTDLARDRLESDLIRWAIEEGKPLLGICRGAQLMNVALGGTLHQDATSVYDQFRPTSGLYRKATFRRPIYIVTQGWLSRLLGTGKKTHLVNSLHHQAIAEVASPLEVAAVDEHGMIQGVELKRKDVFTIGVQWHPELIPHSPVQTSFFRELVRVCQG